MSCSRILRHDSEGDGQTLPVFSAGRAFQAGNFDTSGRLVTAVTQAHSTQYIAGQEIRLRRFFQFSLTAARRAAGRIVQF
jgi:hypothetical protein